MVIRLFSVCLLLCWLAAPAVAAAPVAELDRPVVSLGDSLTLTIRVDGTGSEPPNLDPLKLSFRILGTSQSSRHSIVNGRVSSSTEWRTTLMPRREGTLHIPAIAVGSEFTLPLTVKVEPAATAAAGDNPVFMEAEINRDRVYVDAELILTARIYIDRAIELENLALQAPAFDDASIEQLSEANFDRQINGHRYRVYERRYGIYPHRPGELIIPELVFNALQPTRRRSLFDMPGQGTPLQRLSRQLSVQVMPPPAGFPGKVWLPARDLKLSQQWQGDDQGLKVGDSITRTLTLKAEGVLASQLPALPRPELDTARVYPTKPTLENTPGSQGMSASRTEQFTLLPTESGALSLPPVRIPWWDTEADRLRWAELPRTALQVAAGSATAPRDNTAVNAEPAVPVPAPADTGAPTPQPAPLVGNPWPWQALSGALLALWLITLGLWWRARRSASAGTADSSASARRSPAEAACYKILKAACETRQPAAAEQALQAWLRSYLQMPDAALGSLLQQLDNKALSTEAARLQQQLYGAVAGASDWQGRGLLTAVDGVRAQSRDQRDKPDTRALPALYPDRR